MASGMRQKITNGVCMTLIGIAVHKNQRFICIYLFIYFWQMSYVHTINSVTLLLTGFEQNRTNI